MRLAAGWATNSYIYPDSQATSPAQGFSANNDPDGNILHVVGYDTNKHEIAGPYDKFSLEAGGTADVVMNVDGGKDLNYVQIVAGDNGVCLSWITT